MRVRHGGSAEMALGRPQFIWYFPAPITLRRWGLLLRARALRINTVIEMNNHPLSENRFSKIQRSKESGPVVYKPAIAYELSGRGPAVVFVHGLTYDRCMWGPSIRHLRSAFTCVAIDLPGHGESADAASYRLESVARSLHSLIVHLKLDAPILVGHSAGAILGSVYAASHPVAGIVTSDQKLHTPDFITRLQGMRAQLESPAFPALWRAIESSFGIELIPEPDRRLVIDRAKPRQEISLGYWQEVFTSTPQETEKRFRSLFSKIQAPLIAVFGSDVEPSYRAWMNAVLPHNELIIFPNAGHFPHLVDPEAFARVVRRVAASATDNDVMAEKSGSTNAL